LLLCIPFDSGLLSIGQAVTIKLLEAGVYQFRAAADKAKKGGQRFHAGFITTSCELAKMLIWLTVDRSKNINPREGAYQMKPSRFFTMILIALMTVGAMGFASTRSLARTLHTYEPQVQATSVAPPAANAVNDPASEAVGVEEPSQSPDNDAIQEQVGDQMEDGQPDGVEAPGTENAGPDEQTPSYAGSISLDQTATEGMSETDEAAALAGQATISVDEAKAAAVAANPGTTVVKAELDNENGSLVYSVELSNGSDVKVDAGNGAILHTDMGGDSEG